MTPTNDPTYETMVHNRLAKPQMHIYLVFIGLLHTLVEILKYALLHVQLPPPGGERSITDDTRWPTPRLSVDPRSEQANEAYEKAIHEYVQRNIINHEEQWRIQKIIEYHNDFIQHNPTHVLFSPTGWIDIPLLIDAFEICSKLLKHTKKVIYPATQLTDEAELEAIRTTLYNATEIFAETIEAASVDKRDKPAEA